MVRTILETEKIYDSNKIHNINKVAVQAKTNCELLTLVISVCFFIIIIILVCVDLGLFGKNKVILALIFFITKMKAGQRSKHLFLK